MSARAIVDVAGHRAQRLVGSGNAAAVPARPAASVDEPIRRRAMQRMFRIDTDSENIRGRPFSTVKGADAQTSMADARAALCIAHGVPLDEIGPLGHNLSGRSLNGGVR